MPAGKIIYVDGLQKNIIVELAVSDFIHIHQAMNPMVRTEYVEVHEIGIVSYRSMHTVTKIGNRWLSIIARIIPGVSVTCVSSAKKWELSQIYYPSFSILHSLCIINNYILNNFVFTNILIF